MKLKTKVAITAGSILGTSSALLAIMYAYSLNSHVVIGKKNRNNLSLVNDFKNLKNYDMYFYHPTTKKEVANFDAKNNKVLENGKSIPFNDFLINFSNNNDGETPVFLVETANMRFVNKYTEVISPADFVSYINWFLDNVAWGPDIITLKSFTIEKGVNKQGSAIILGGHQNHHKEVKEITFYPDSFFGSLPLYNTETGRSNAADRLLVKLNETLITRSEVDTYLDNVWKYNILANDTTPSIRQIIFRNLSFAHFLKDKELYYTVNNNGKTIFINANSKLEAFNKIVEFNKNQKFASTRIVQNITAIHKTKISLVGVVGANLNLTYDTVKNVSITANDYTPETLFSLSQLEEIQNSGIVNFRDLYNLGQYKNNVFFIQEFDKSKQKYPQLFRSIISVKENLKNDFDETKLHTYVLKDIYTENKKLHIKLDPEFSKTPELETIIIDAYDESQETFDFLFNLTRALGYRKSVTPFLVENENEIKDESGKVVNYYAIYNEVYQDLLDTVLRKYPYFSREQDGEYIEKTIDENGVYKYEMKKGIHKGFVLSDRIAFLHILAATDPNFKGVGVDFLKYVGAHEYGHHSTLENIQNLSDGKNPILLGGLNSRSGPSEISFYNKRIVQDYLDARSSGLVLNPTDVLDSAAQGEYPNFAFKDTDKSKKQNTASSANNTETKQTANISAETDSQTNTDELKNETNEDIWGLPDNQNSVLQLIKNARRRFLQNFDGLKEAAKLRNLKVYDLFLLNAFDTHAGTINPELMGPTSYFDANKNFVQPTYESILSQITDGIGNPITFDKREDDNPLVLGMMNYFYDPQVIEYKTNADGVRVVKRVLIYDKNNQPVINVKEDDIMTQAQTNLENEIKLNILSLIQLQYTNLGWENRSAVTNLQEELGLSFKRSNFEGVALESSEVDYKPHVDYLKRYFEEKDSLEENNYLSRQTLLEKMRNTNLLNIYALVKRINDVTAYQEATTNQEAINLATQTTETLDAQSYIFGLQGSLVKFQSNGLSYFADYTKLPSAYEENPQIVNFLGGKLSRGISFAYNATIVKSLRAAQANPDNPNMFRFTDFSNRPIDESNGGNYSLINKIALDPQAHETRENKFLSYLFDAFKEENLVDYQSGQFIPGTTNLLKEKTLGFSNYESFTEFASIDLSQFTIANRFIEGKKVPYRNFNVAYVKTKFDIAKFIANYTKWVLSLDQTDEFKRELLLKVDTEQDAANELMERFLKSKLQVFVKNIKVTENFENVKYAMEQDLGLTELKDKNIVLTNNPDREKFEITPQEVYQLFMNYLTKNNIGIKSGQTHSSIKLSIFDVLLLTGKIAFTRNKPENINGINALNSLPEDLVSSFLKADYKKWGPSNDVVTAAATRYEQDLQQIFSDYVYSVAEVLTRDYVQTTYVPNSNDFSTLPNYLKGASESNTGFEFFLTATQTNIWKESKINVPASFNNISVILSAITDEKRNIQAEIKRQEIIDNNDNVRILRQENEKLEQEKAALENEFQNKNREKISRGAILNEQLTELNTARQIENNNIILYSPATVIDPETGDRINFKDNNGNFVMSGIYTARQNIIDADEDIERRKAEEQNLISNGEKIQAAIEEENKKIDNPNSTESSINAAKQRKQELEAEKVNNNTAIQIVKDRILALNNFKDNELERQSQFILLKPVDGLLKERVDNALLEILEIDSKIAQINEEVKVITSELEPLIDELSDKISRIEGRQEDLRTRIQAEESKLEQEFRNLTVDGVADVLSLNRNLNLRTAIFDNTYFGVVNSQNNGYFKDRWLRKELGWEIYDDAGNPVVDENIKIKKLNGEKVTNRAEAVWTYLLRSKNVGNGTITGLWRDRERDANALWGYVPNEIGAKIKYLKFTNIATNQTFFLSVHTKNTNKLFYLTKQGDIDSKHTLFDEGYTSWISDYAYMAKYNNAALKPGNRYYVEFADENKNVVEGFSLPDDVNVFGENGKTIAQSPTYLIKTNDKKSVLVVQDQFNV